MEMTESLYGGVAVVITAGLPASEAVIGVGMWCQLGHSEGYRCRGIKKPAAMDRTNLRIGILHDIIVRSPAGPRQQGHQAQDH